MNRRSILKYIGLAPIAAAVPAAAIASPSSAAVAASVEALWQQSPATWVRAYTKYPERIAVLRTMIDESREFMRSNNYGRGPVSVDCEAAALRNRLCRYELERIERKLAGVSQSRFESENDKRQRVEHLEELRAIRLDVWREVARLDSTT